MKEITTVKDALKVLRQSGTSLQIAYVSGLLHTQVLQKKYAILSLQEMQDTGYEYLIDYDGNRISWWLRGDGSIVL
jgi:hypothetical protein